MEQLIFSFKLPFLSDFEFIQSTVGYFYRKTGHKLSINFNGSKGYLDNIEFQCEGFQKNETNIIRLHGLLTTKGELKKKNVSFYHSEENGIRIVI